MTTSSTKMAQKCFRIPELVGMICNEQDDVPTMLAMALTSRAYLEPALDRLWYRIKSFKLLIAFLPRDLWIVEKRPDTDTLPYKPARAANPEDLERYLTYYTGRIRQFHVHGFCSGPLSPEAFGALKFATNRQDGVLAPRITSFYWLRSSEEQEYPTIVTLCDQIYPFISLFMGPKISELAFDVTPESTTQIGYVRSSLERYPKLEGLHFVLWNHEFGFPEHLAQEYLQMHSWDHLESLVISDVWNHTIPLLASLPRLIDLQVVDLKPISSPNVSRFPKNTSQGFAALESLEISAETLQGIVHFIQYLPLAANSRIHPCCANFRRRRIEGFRWVLTRLMSCWATATVDWSSVVASKEFFLAEPMDVDPDARLDISPLYKYRNLVELEINLVQDVWPTPEEVTQQFPMSWPNICSLKLSVDPDLPGHRLPRIDYTHVMELLRACRNIKILGLRFDATGIQTGEKVTGLYGNRLTVLYVGDLPIYSPGRVIVFLYDHFPELKRLYTFTSPESYERVLAEERPVPLYNIGGWMFLIGLVFTFPR